MNNMPQFECKKDSRVHWHFVPATDSLLEKYKNCKSNELEQVFIDFAKNGELIKECFMRRKGIKLTVTKYKNMVALTSCINNGMGAYQGQFFVSDDPNAEKDLLALYKCYIKGVTTTIRNKIINGVFKTKEMN